MALQLRSSKSRIFQNPNLINFFSTTAASLSEPTTADSLSPLESTTADSLPESNPDEETTQSSPLPSLASIFKGIVNTNHIPLKVLPPKPPSTSVFLDNPKELQEKVEKLLEDNRRFDSPSIYPPPPKISVQKVGGNDKNEFLLSKLHTVKENVFSKKKNRFRNNNNNSNWLNRVENSDPFESLGEVVKVKRNGDNQSRENEGAGGRKDLEVEVGKRKDVGGGRMGLFKHSSDANKFPALNLPTKPRSEVDTKEKGKVVKWRWTSTTDNILLDTLVDQATDGKKRGDAWEDKAWKVVTDAIFQKTHKEATRKQIDCRLGMMRSEYQTFLELRRKSGFQWCPIKQNVIASDEQWNEFLADDRANKKYRSFRDRGPKWDFVKLEIIFGDRQAIESSAEGGLHCIETEKTNENANQYAHRRDDSDSDKSEDISDEKKVSQIGMMRDMIREMTSIFIDKLSKSVGPLSVEVQLHEELMKMEGFSADYLDSAFELLMRDRIGTKIFLIRNVTYRKKMLENMREKIGDI